MLTDAFCRLGTEATAGTELRSGKNAGHVKMWPPFADVVATSVTN